MTNQNKTIKEYVHGLKPSLLGKIIYYCLPYRKRTVLKNMAFVFNKSLNKHEIQTLAICFYSHLLKSFVENVKFHCLSPDKLDKKITVEGEDHILNAIKHKKGVLILTGHLGNWEFAPISGIKKFTSPQCKFYFIRRMIKIKCIEKALFARYHQAGLRVIPNKNAISTATDVLEKNNAVIFVMDQHTKIEGKSAKRGIAVDFFGKKAGTYRTLAMLARYSGAHVLPATSFRQPDGHHVLKFYPAIPWQSHENNKEEIYLNTLAYNQLLEKMILEHPEQWIWSHRRWKLKDPTDVKS